MKAILTTLVLLTSGLTFADNTCREHIVESLNLSSIDMLTEFNITTICNIKERETISSALKIVSENYVEDSMNGLTSAINIVEMYSSDNIECGKKLINKNASFSKNAIGLLNATDSCFAINDN